MDKRAVIALVLSAALLATVATACHVHIPDRGQDVVVASTTSTFDSGLFDYIIPHFEERYPVKVKVLAKGTGEAIEVAKRGDADLVLVHARSLEEAFVEEGYGIHRVCIMFNDFLIIGPWDDPAGVSGARDAEEGFARIAEAGRRGEAIFISRADRSGTHIKEIGLWEAAGGAPSGAAERWYFEAGSGMGAVIRMAEEKKAYTLTDRATWSTFQSQVRGLKPLVEGVPELANPYSVILVNPQRYPHRNYRFSVALVKFLISPEGQRLIGEFKKEGTALFTPVARDVDLARQLGFPEQAAELTWYDSIDPAYLRALSFWPRLSQELGERSARFSNNGLKYGG
ncbi:MAG: substrate-binding domain-containing protein [Candidatus Bathyarchaeia archaeon]